MIFSFYIVDTFTSKPFKGNAAAVVLLDAFPADAVMQTVATQMNLSETAFLAKTAPLTYNLRWFTPAVEVNLCGHATLAATHILRQCGHISNGDTVAYQTLSGELCARALDNGVELDFPSLPGEPVKPHPALKALGVDMVACERNRDNYLVEVKDFAALQDCTPSFRKLAKMDMQGVIVTTAAGVTAKLDDKAFDFASRYFAPNCGIDEDPVTGSAHCFLAPYWAKKLGKATFHALQSSKGEGILDVTLKGDRVLIAGNVITTLKGQLPLAKAKKEPEKTAA